MNSQDKDFSGLRCLQVLFAQFRQRVNFSALVTDNVQKNYVNDSCGILMKLSEEQKLRPEKSSKIDDLLDYAGPVVLQLKNDRWILVLNGNQLVSQDAKAASIIDPCVGTKILTVPVQQILEQFAQGIVFHNLTQVDAAKQSRLYSFITIARHNKINVDIREIMHEYAVKEEEVKDNLFRQIVTDYMFKMKFVTLSWDKLKKCSSLFPMIAVKNNEKYAVFCGMRKTEGGEVEAVLVDPESDVCNKPEHFLFVSQKEFENLYSGKFILLKKNYKLTDDNQPFSLRWFMPEFLRNKKIFGEIALMVVMLSLFSLIIPLFFQIVVDKVLVNKAYNTLNVLGWGILGAVIFNALVSYVRSYLLLFATNKIDIATAIKTFSHLMKLPVDFFERIPSGVLLKHMQQTEKIRGFLSGNLFFTILDLLALIIFIPFLLCYSITLTLVVLLFSAAMAIVIASLIRPFQHRLDELYQAEGKRQSMLVEAIQGIKTVKSLALEPVEKKFWNDTSAYAISSYFNVGKISMTAQSISQMLEMMMSICVIWIGAHLVFDQIISIGALIAFQMLANRVSAPLVKLVGLIHEYQQIALSVRMLGVVMNSPQESGGGGVRNLIKGKVEFSGVTFRYRQDLEPVIHDFSLNISEGKTVGIVGRSGSGKTTLSKLLQGLYSPGQGLIRIDDIDIREIDKAHLRRNIGIVLQDNYFFSGTVRENIALPKQNASLEEIIFASKLSGADEFVQRLPRGYDTLLEENASNLSGGQKQRLAIARALLTNPPILIFDEATSSLDPESEELIRRNLDNIAKGRTVIIISHRLNMICKADVIIVMEKGRLCASGTHRQLLEQPGIYRDFWMQQMRGEN